MFVGKVSNDDPEDTKPRKAYRYEENFSDDLLGLKGKKHVDSFVRDFSDNDHYLVEPDPSKTQPTKVVRPPAPRVEKFKFHWGAFFVMILAIGAALIVGYIIPGPFDEFLATVAISSVYGFLNSHDFKLKNIFKK